MEPTELEAMELERTASVAGYIYKSLRVILDYGIGMTQARKTQVLTLTALAVAFAAAVARKQLASSAPAQPSSPQDAIYAMLEASRAGDVRRYLANYGGQMRASLDQSLRESGEERFSRYLKESNAAIKGVAVSEPQSVSSRESKVRVEYVYQDRNEAQTLYLENDGAWKITRVDATDRVKTLIPYGTPVQ